MARDIEAQIPYYRTMRSLGFLLVRAALVLATLLTAAGTVRAQTATGGNQQAATLHFRNGQQAFVARRFDVAAREFEVAYELTHDPLLLFNLGAAREQIPDVAGALDAYQRFLQAMPNAPNRVDVDARVSVLRRSQTHAADSANSTATSSPAPATAAASSPPPTVAAQSASGSPSPGGTTAATVHDGAGTSVATDSRSHTLRWVGLVGVVLGVAAGVTAAVLWVTATSDNSRYSVPGACSTDCISIADGIETRATATSVLMPTALGLGVLGIAAIAIDLAMGSGSSEHPHVTAGAGWIPGGGAAILQGTF